MSIIEDLGTFGPHFAIGSLILVGLASSEFVGGATVIALPITALVVFLGELCMPSLETIARKRKCSDAPEFLLIWLNLLQHLIAAATSARVASTTMDYMSKGKLRNWLFGVESHSLGEHWPDVVGLTIILITTALFMLGLDRSLTFSILLYLGLGVSYAFFILAGSFHTDTKFWIWTEDFNLKNWDGILTTAAMCAFAFPASAANPHRKNLFYRSLLLIIVPTILYSSIILVFTLMSHYKELTGTAIPLVRVFEVRNVEWAKLIMAICTIFIGCISLMEIIPALHDVVILLANREWNIFIPSMIYRNPITGAPVLTIFAAGSLTSILAFSCPLFYLVRLLNICPLLKGSLQSTLTLYLCYKPEINDTCIGNTYRIKYNKLDQQIENKSRPRRRIKAVFDVLPRMLGNTTATVEHPSNKSKKVIVEDQECLLMDDYRNISSQETVIPDSDPESDDNEAISICTDVDDSSSSTDVDAAVQEYKDQIEVTFNNLTTTQLRPSTVINSQIVLTSVSLIIALTIATTAGILYMNLRLILLSVLITVLCSIIILQRPKNRIYCQTSFQKLLPFICILSLVINAILANILLVDVWLGVVLWLCGGLILFFRCECCNCEGLYTPDRESMRLNLSTKNPLSYSDELIDTISASR